MNTTTRTIVDPDPTGFVPLARVELDGDQLVFVVPDPSDPGVRRAAFQWLISKPDVPHQSYRFEREDHTEPARIIGVELIVPVDGAPYITVGVHPMSGSVLWPAFPVDALPDLCRAAGVPKPGDGQYRLNQLEGRPVYAVFDDGYRMIAVQGAHGAYRVDANRR